MYSCPKAIFGFGAFLISDKYKHRANLPLCLHGVTFCLYTNTNGFFRCVLFLIIKRFVFLAAVIILLFHVIVVGLGVLRIVVRIAGACAVGAGA